MAEQKKLPTPEMLDTPGVFFNPQTEVLVVVDDSADIDRQIFNMEEAEGADWVQISDEVPVDEDARDTLLQQFQTRYHAGGQTSLSAVGAEMQQSSLEDGDSQEVGRE